MEHDESLISRDIELQAQIYCLIDILQLVVHAVVYHRDAVGVHAAATLKECGFCEFRHEDNLVDFAIHALVYGTALRLSHGVAGHHHASVLVFRDFACEQSCGGVFGIVHVHNVLAPLYEAGKAQRAFDVGEPL